MVKKKTSKSIIPLEKNFLKKLIKFRKEKQLSPRGKKEIDSEIRFTKKLIKIMEKE